MAMTSQITITVEDSTVGQEAFPVKVVHFDGQFDERNVDEQAKTMYEFLETVQPGSTILFDFSNLRYMNSKSIGYLMDWHTRIQQHKSHLVVVAAQPNINDILSLVGITKLVPMCGNLDEVPALLARTPISDPSRN